MTYWKTCLWTAILVTTMAAAGCGGGAEKATSSAAAAPVLTTMQPQALRQIVAADNTKGRTIMWQLKTEKDCTLEYRVKGSDGIFSEKATSKAYKGNNGFSARTYLYHIFKLKEGCTPAEWQEKMAENVAAEDKKQD